MQSQKNFYDEEEPDSFTGSFPDQNFQGDLITDVDYNLTNDTTINDYDGGQGYDEEDEEDYSGIDYSIQLPTASSIVTSIAVQPDISSTQSRVNEYYGVSSEAYSNVVGGVGTIPMYQQQQQPMAGGGVATQGQYTSQGQSYSSQYNYSQQGNYTIATTPSTKISSYIPPTNMSNANYNDRDIFNISLGKGDFVSVMDNKDVKVRFIFGLRENNKPPATGTGERDVYKRNWSELKTFAIQHNWRHILAHDFTGDLLPTIAKRKKADTRIKRGDPSMPFELNNLKWKTVVHYLIGMAYVNDPEYMILFSLSGIKEDKETQNFGFWNSVFDAYKEHQLNIMENRRKLDLDYFNKRDTYFRDALLAKFTQNPVAKKALLLTDDAILAVKVFDGILEYPIMSLVREYIKNNPNIIYKGEGLIEQVENPIDVLVNTESLNRIKQIDPNSLLQNVSRNIFSAAYKPVKLTNIFQFYNINPEIVETEPIKNKQLCYIYAVTGAFAFNFEPFISQFGQPTFMKRHIYGIETVAYNSTDHLFIGIEKYATSIIRQYVKFDYMIETRVNSNIVDGSIFIPGKDKQRKSKSRRKKKPVDEDEEDIYGEYDQQQEEDSPEGGIMVDVKTPISIYMQFVTNDKNSQYANRTASIFIISAVKSNEVKEFIITLTKALSYVQPDQ